MIAGLFRDALSWVAGLLEAAGAVAAILLIGLVVGMAGFWILVRSMRKLAGPSAESDPEDYELDEDVDRQTVPIQQDEDLPPV